MHGNVWEWVDGATPTPSAAVMRGGSAQTTAASLRCSNSLIANAQNRFDDFGLRVVRDMR
jgi:formylglycine-generating enzyme required for sulfatase activity